MVLWLSLAYLMMFLLTRVIDQFGIDYLEKYQIKKEKRFSLLLS